MVIVPLSYFFVKSLIAAIIARANQVRLAREIWALRPEMVLPDQCQIFIILDDGAIAPSLGEMTPSSDIGNK